MCGLAGRFHPVHLPAATNWAAEACALLAHRGPDGAGQFRDERCELVHRRLALIDLTHTGRQPMGNEDGSVQVVFNGEIYNHRELRSQLVQRGHVFRGTSDTEVIVHLYEELGVRLVEKLRGIFAFALYDVARRSLLLARDRFGVKPLFYARAGEQWIFASEMKAILAHPEFRPQLDRQACFDFLGLGFIPEPATGFSNIAALPGGHTLTVRLEGERLTSYEKVTARPDAERTLEQTADELEQRMLDAVSRQSVADVPVASLLSGGIDSSLVVAAQHRISTRTALTFNVRFPDRDHDETPLALSVAEYCGTEHHTIDVDEQRLTPETLLQLFRHFDQPFADTSLIPMYWVSAAVRDRGVVCTLSGDGGDEAFGGYARFWRVNRIAGLMRAPSPLRHAALHAGRALAHWTSDRGRQLAKAAALANAARRNAAALLSGFSNYLSEEEKQELVRPEANVGLLPCDRHFDDYAPAASNDLEELSRRITEKQFAVSLPSDMLRKVDMMSMRASIEVRVPLLDEELVALGLTLSHRLKTDGRRGKLVLRELAKRWLPRRVASHPKHGFTIPLDVMLSRLVHGRLQELICAGDARTSAFLNSNLVRNWLTRLALAGNGDGGGTMSRGGLYQRVFTVLSLELWLRDHALAW
jgi:asparagine synthase (glutamine-hydrolysing)